MGYVVIVPSHEIPLYPGISQKRRGNRRYYQRRDIVLIRQIRSLLYEHGFTIRGARQKLSGEEARGEINQSRQLIRQVRMELEEVLAILEG